MWHIFTPYGSHYRVDNEGRFIVDGKPSKGWKFLGIRHVKETTRFVPFKTLKQVKSILKGDFIWLYKNGHPRWTVEDLDCGTTRTWGNTKYHGIKIMYWSKSE